MMMLPGIRPGALMALGLIISDYLLCPRVPVGGGSLWVRGTDGGTEGEREGVFTWLQLESFPVKGRQDYLCNII